MPTSGEHFSYSKQSVTLTQSSRTMRLSPTIPNEPKVMRVGHEHAYVLAILWMRFQTSLTQLNWTQLQHTPTIIAAMCTGIRVTWRRQSLISDRPSHWTPAFVADGINLVWP